MASKQEKLAAARKKLREFQGKQRESDNSKMKIVPEELVPKLILESSPASVESSPSCTPIISSCKKLYDDQKDVHSLTSNIKELEDQNIKLDNNKRTLQPADIYIRPITASTNWMEGNNEKSQENVLEPNGKHIVLNKENINQLEGSVGLQYIPNRSNLIEGDIKSTPIFNYSTSNISDDKNGYQSKKSRTATPEIDFKNILTDSGNIFNQKDNVSVSHSEVPEINNCSFEVNHTLDDIIKPLQTELQNHAQTINILVQQRNEAQNALSHAQNLLSKESEEITEQKIQLNTLNLSINELNKKLTEADKMSMHLHSEIEAKNQQINELFASYQALKVQFDSKEEECSELKRKYEEKSKECQHLLYTLNKAQSQLSLCQIQIQNQPFADNNYSLMHRLSVIENENINLNEQLDTLKKEIEAANVEKELSSQNFKAYAQQCKEELSALNFQLKEITSENEKLKQINEAIPSMVPVTVEKLKEDDLLVDTYKTEIADLHTQISQMTEKKNELEKRYQKLESENSALKTDNQEKGNELQNALSLLREAEVENKRLLLEVDEPKANERLLATIESDKVAAAKAVSQNQKLKNHVMELEEAFVKLSEEKLELTDKLSHEKHINKELQSRLESMETDDFRHDDHNDHQHHHHNHHDHTSHDGDCEYGEKESSLVNDGQEIKELKKIIRQLQDDKVELKSRLNLLNAPEINNRQGDQNLNLEGECKLENGEGETEENARVRLQQMEEKVRKTMNEIAILDEEKEKLEHLVLQLQGETETIGEYITLYQKQRMVLKQRAQEKDNQLIQLSKDKEELKSKLHDLDELVQHLLKEKADGGSLQDSSISSLEATEKKIYDNTAVKIRALISEIGSTNLVNSQSVAFKHCSCCSGRLITI